MFSSRAACTKWSKSASVPSAGSMASWPPFSLPIAHGLPTSSGSGVSELFLPFRNVWPIGWMGGRYTTSKPSPAIRASACDAVVNVPCLPVESVERGNSSYHAAKRARSRSTMTASSRP